MKAISFENLSTVLSSDDSSKSALWWEVASIIITSLIIMMIPRLQAYVAYHSNAFACATLLMFTVRHRIEVLSEREEESKKVLQIYTVLYRHLPIKVWENETDKNIFLHSRSILHDLSRTQMLLELK